MQRIACVAVVMTVLVAGSCAPDNPPPPLPPVVEGFANVLVTTGDGSKLLVDEPRVALTAAPAAGDVVIDVDRSARYQTMDGVGAAMTESSAHVISTRLDATTRTQVVNDLFGPRGAHMSAVRIPLSSTDFSLTDHTYDDVAAPGTDPELAGLSLAVDDAEVVPLLRAAAAVNPDLFLMGSPWTAPGWMKVGNSTDRAGVIGGTLAPDMVGTYAAYLRRVVTGYRDRGLPLDAITLQNEPAHVSGNYAGMLLSSSQEADLAVAVDAELRAAGASTDIVVHDHNWNRSDRALEVLGDPEASPVIAGSAFHCYNGSPDAQTAVHDAFPAKDVYFTECTGTETSGTFESNLLWNARVLFVGATRNWAKTVLLWNLALDETGGPRVGGCSSCRGVLTIHSDGHVTRNEEFYALAQFGRGVDAGAVRLGSSAASGGVSNVAFENPDGTTAVLLTSTSSTATTVAIGDGDRSMVVTVPARSVVTVRWR